MSFGGGGGEKGRVKKKGDLGITAGNSEGERRKFKGSLAAALSISGDRRKKGTKKLWGPRRKKRHGLRNRPTIKQPALKRSGLDSLWEKKGGGAALLHGQVGRLPGEKTECQKNKITMRSKKKK